MTGMEMTYAYRVVHAGVGRGWFVVCDIRTVSGPYTTKAQAEAKADALRVPHTPEPEHSYHVRPWVR